MIEMKVLNDFLWWLSVGGILKRYWSAVEYACFDKKILQADFIKRMDATDPNTLFDLLIDCGFLFFKKAKEKYINWLITEQ
jgi:hypothetical protein